MTSAAIEQGLITVAIPASTDLSAKQYYLMKIDTNGQLAVCGEGGNPVGVLQDAPAAANRPGCVAVGGITRVLAGGSFNPGDRLSSDSNGKAVAVGSSDDYCIGIALAAGASGKIAHMLIQKTGTA